MNDRDQMNAIKNNDLICLQSLFRGTIHASNGFKEGQIMPAVFLIQVIEKKTRDLSENHSYKSLQKFLSRKFRHVCDLIWSLFIKIAFI